MGQPTVIFDFFGVISTEVLPFWFQRYFSSDEATRLTDLYCPQSDSGAISEKEWFETMARLVKKTPTEVRTEFGSYMKINDRVVALIKTLTSSGKVGLCSNTIGTYLRPLLAHYTLTELFDAIIISSECGIVKPDPRIFRLAAEKLGVPPETVIFIDDKLANVEAAQTVGMKGVVFKTVESLRAELLQNNVRHL